MSATTPNPGFIRNTSGGIPSVCRRHINSGIIATPGHMACWDVGANTERPVVSDSDSATFEGVFYDQSPNQSFAVELSDVMLIKADGSNIHELYVTAGETYYQNDPVYIVNSVTIKKAAGTNAIGNIELPYKVASILGVAGNKIPVRLRSVYTRAH